MLSDLLILPNGFNESCGRLESQLITFTAFYHCHFLFQPACMNADTFEPQQHKRQMVFLPFQAGCYLVAFRSILVC
jgi:hypothetical protein